MKAVFKVVDTIKDWEPPFKTVNDEKEFTVGEGEEFSQDKDKGFLVFKVLKVESGKALVEFSNQYTQKGHEHIKDRQIWMALNASEKFSALWSKRGLTKLVQFEGLALAEHNEMQTEQIQA